jgi:hypothetical protein
VASAYRFNAESLLPADLIQIRLRFPWFGDLPICLLSLGSVTIRTVVIASNRCAIHARKLPWQE